MDYEHTNPVIPMLYGLPKIHEPTLKMRSIVSNINAPTYKLPKWIVTKFKEFHQPKGRYIKNSFDFADKMMDIKLKEDLI